MTDQPPAPPSPPLLPPPPAASLHDLASAGLEAGQSMMAASAGAASSAPVSIDAAAFTQLGELLVALARAARRCGGEDCFARPVNGVRSWVPSQVLDETARRIEALEHEIRTLREALTTIAQSRPALLPRRSPDTPQSIALAALEAFAKAAR